jgi:hypothetical protein
MALRITKKQVEAAAKAREKALKDDPEFRGFEEQQTKEIQAAVDKKKQEGKD